jgi:hypothetical protein
MSQQPDEALEVLRSIWSAQGQTSADLDEACGNTKSCKRMADVSFDGLADPDQDLRAAWRAQLARGRQAEQGGRHHPRPDHGFTEGPLTLDGLPGLRR